MAMDKTVLGPALKAARDSVMVSPSDSTYGEKIAEAEADAIIQHIKTYMEIAAVENENIAITVGGGSGAPATGSVSSQGQTKAITAGSGKIS